MKTAAVCTIGTELTRGEIVDTNAAWLSEKLTEIGFEVVVRSTVPDAQSAIVDELRSLSKRVDFVAVSGGLGPTSDDITAQCAAMAFGVERVLDPGALDAIARRFKTLGRTLNESSRQVAMVPKGALVLSNPRGMAPGFWIKEGRADLCFAPGVPAEMKAIFEEHIFPKLRETVSAQTVQRVLRVYGLAESTIGEMLGGLEQEFVGLTIGYRVVFPEILVKATVRDQDAETAHKICDQVCKKIESILGPSVYAEQSECESYAHFFVKKLRQSSLTVAFVESCTGGLASSLVTSVPGSSEVLKGACVTYLGETKSKLVGVGPQVIEQFGEVSAEVAEAMALGGRNILEADYVVSITGIAGPTGGTGDTPVGTVWFGIAGPNGVQTIKKMFLPPREWIQRSAAFFALSWIISKIAASGSA